MLYVYIFAIFIILDIQIIKLLNDYMLIYLYIKMFKVLYFDNEIIYNSLVTDRLLCKYKLYFSSKSALNTQIEIPFSPAKTIFNFQSASQCHMRLLYIISLSNIDNILIYLINYYN